MIKIKKEAIESHTISIRVDNEAGVLARVIGLFSGRGYNIESLTVAEVDQDSHKSRITIVTHRTKKVLYQIQGEKREEVIKLSEIYRAKIVDTTKNSFVFELTGAIDKINSFIEMLRPLGLEDISRTGLAAISRGTKK